jgi:hypothetical protein
MAVDDCRDLPPLIDREDPMPLDDTMHLNPERRALLMAAVAFVGAASFAAWSSERVHRTRWLSRIARFDSASAALGRHYLHEHPTESLAVLEQELLGSPATDVTGDVRHRLSRLNDADYADGNLVVLDGWLVTRTEARLLALVALYVDA